MNAFGKALVTVTAVVAVALACVGCGASATNVGVVQAPTATPTAAPSATAAPTPSLTPTAAPAPTPQVLLSDDFSALEPGRRYALPIRGTNPGITFAVPSGWVGNQTLATKDYGDSGPDGPVWFPQPFDHGFKNPCTDHTPGPAGSGIRARRPPQSHRGSAGHQGRADHGRHRRRPRREVHRVHRHRRSRNLRG